MDFFNYILRRILNKIPLKLLLLILVVLISLFLFNTYSNADSEPPPNNDIPTILNIINTLDARVYAVTGVDISNFTNWYFTDYDRNCYQIVVLNHNKISFNAFTDHTSPIEDNGIYNIYGWSHGGGNTLYLYSIDFDTFNVTITPSLSGRVYNRFNLNYAFDMENTFNIFNFMYVKYNPTYLYNGDTTDILTWNTTLTNKVTPIEPYFEYSTTGDSIIFNNYLIINPANTEYINNTYLSFSLELWNSDGLDLADGVPFYSILLTPESSYWDSSNKVYKIPFYNSLSLWLTENENYTFLINLFTNDHFYCKFEAATFDYIGGLMVLDDVSTPSSPSGVGDSITTPNYSQINDINSSINNSNIDNMTNDFTDLADGFNVNDPTGLDTIFQKLYNAFCTDNIINVSFTIPFVNKQVTISTTNVSNYFPNEIKSIVSVFVWGIIGLWVLKDIRSIVDKISEGSPENVGSDVKKEVL